MSAWVCNDTHINLILATVANRPDPGTHLTHGDMPTLGRLLLAENVRSVLHRYGPETIDAEETAEYAAQVDGFTYDHLAVTTPVEAIKLLMSWRYQTCETEDHRDTEAWKRSDDLLDVLVGMLPGYTEARWSAW